MNDNLLTLLVNGAKDVLSFHESGYSVDEDFRPRFINALATFLVNADWADATLMANDDADDPSKDFDKTLRAVAARDGVKIDYLA